MTVAVLFARADSVYKTMPGCDVYDEARVPRSLPICTKFWREATPPELAAWLVEVARRAIKMKEAA